MSADPADLSLVVLKVRTLRLAGFFQEADRRLAEAIERRPDALRLRKLAAKTALDQGRFEAALSQSREAIALTPRDAATQDLLAQALVVRAMDDRTDWSLFFADRRREGLHRVCTALLRAVDETFGLAREAPALFAELAAWRALVPELRDEIALPSAYSLGNKWWGWSLYDTNRLRILAWWLVSLPFRIAVHHTGAASTRRRARRALSAD
jgi:tetratricopeptide (TPR) repeat protein